MLLKKIKLAGFKSFLDPTTLDVQGQLMGVVGPNGCGKSNIIDAVRWVMGESSAKTLRGESMEDVIFNGSATRKPVGQASVDLIFDNSMGSLGGEYASYAEIALRREVVRDGHSNYYLNGTKCRKRDIIDVFLGTGLGPRSYSIIEQGMISRVIEAKPEDLRAFLEEAAGISIYKKRRHDTEIRMRHTKENLDRLADIISEHETQLTKLKQQSAAAERYKTYQAEKQILEIELLALKAKNYDGELEVYSKQIRELANQLEENLANIAHIDYELEKSRVEHAEKMEGVNKIQADFYNVNSQIARHEQTLQHHQEKMQQLQADLKETMQHITTAEEQLVKDNSELRELQEQLVIIEPQYEQTAADAKQAEELYHDAETSMHSWMEKWDAFQIQYHKNQEKAEIEKTNIEHLDKQIRECKVWLDRLFLEQKDLNIEAHEKNMQDLAVQLKILEDKEQEYKIALEELKKNIIQQNNIIKEKQKNITIVREKLQTLKGKQASLEALQQAALGKDDTTLLAWMQQQELHDLPRVAEQIQVTPGWEKAVETVLGEYLEAVCVEKFDTLLNVINTLPAINLNFLQLNNSYNKDILNKNLLANVITSTLPLESLLQGIYVAEDLNVAIALQSQLAINESVVTKDGVWLGTNWLRIAAADNKSGVLQREQDLKAINEKLIALQEQAARLEEEITLGEERSNQLHDEQTELQAKERAHTHNLREKSNEVSVAKARYEHVCQRMQNIQYEIKERQQQVEHAVKESSTSRAELELAISKMTEFTENKDLLLKEKETLQRSLQTTRKSMYEHKEEAHQLELKKQALTTKKQALIEGLSRLDQQLIALRDRQNNLNTMLSEDHTPIDAIKNELNIYLEQKIKVEQELQIARLALDQLEQSIHDKEKAKTSKEHKSQEIRNDLDNLRMEWKSLEVRRQTVEESLNALGSSVKQAIEQLSVDANEAECAERLQKITKRIERLGPINLAAMEEYQSELEKQQYLQAQNEDLTKAMEILENAIKKIDRETKAKFKDTFDQVNENFQQLFPKLFGGGNAYLEIAGDDLLAAGVSVMARPPGKRNTSIHLLSGGEKALSAVALVFAIFRLNPAPFCMLDEVDAPLDDANVGRYCDMIKEMSSAVQFIFITHNKITMEIANQLAGVTMKEPGVSRLVSVDIDRAVEMAEA